MADDLEILELWNAPLIINPESGWKYTHFKLGLLFENDKIFWLPLNRHQCRLLARAFTKFNVPHKAKELGGGITQVWAGGTLARSTLPPIRRAKRVQINMTGFRNIRLQEFIDKNPSRKKVVVNEVVENAAGVMPAQVDDTSKD